MSVNVIEGLTKKYILDIGTIHSERISSMVPDCIVHASDVDYGYDYILCGYKAGTKIVSNPSNTGNELIYVVPEDVAMVFSRILNNRKYMNLDWSVDSY